MKKIRKNSRLIKTPLPNGRPLGKKWAKASLFEMLYCPDILGGDYRKIWAVVGRKHVYCSTIQICKSGGNRKATLPRQAWEKLISSKNNRVAVIA